MRKLSSEQIIQIESLRSKGTSFKAVAKLTGLSIGSCYNYARETNLSESAKQKLQINESLNRKKFANKFAQEKPIKKPVIDENFAFILGHLFFDGSVSKSKNGQFVLNYTNASFELLNEFIAAMEIIFGIVPAKTQKFKGVNVDWYEVNFYSKKAYNLLEKISSSFSTKKDIGIPEIIKTAEQSIQRIFLQTFWDDEGCISAHGKLSGCSKSERMIDDLIELHHDLGIVCSKQKSGVCYAINISTKLKNLARFQQLVDFGAGRVVKGINIGKFKKQVLSETLLRKTDRLKTFS